VCSNSRNNDNLPQMDTVRNILLSGLKESKFNGLILHSVIWNQIRIATVKTFLLNFPPSSLLIF